MSRIEKMFEKITRSPNNTNWHELKTTAEYYGCEVEDGAKHKKVFHSSLDRPITVPVHNNKVKTYYVKKVASLIEDILEEE
ncbi:hypothetical protein [Bacillus velezensis]|uniref:hypothetical protein n=1 Tax=Bacillus velezensis TaxID=492670 RepID=UPI0027A1A423|nr:hypothetical protein [Bacillus velezensis]MEC2287305.1 hypothetical protein [Bacillus velezensis]MEC2422420.1 hypothetical protein [Bacillus velezensis]WFF76285.1 hypothetical protein P6282_20850 [Bacillus velezensis]WFF76360.1 hypothetical protein P6282_00240 [Bacillus velezensis]